MKPFVPCGLATAIGSLPHTDPEAACRLVARYLPDLPPWPQLPRRSYLESMYVQFSEGFPGINMSDERIWVEHGTDLAADPLYSLYVESLMAEEATAPSPAGVPGLPKYPGTAVLTGKDRTPYPSFGVSPSHAVGLHTFLAHPPRGCGALKGQVTGPVSLSLALVDRDGRPLLYDDDLTDLMAFHVGLKARWQQAELQRHCAETIIFLDEPYLASIGSAFVSLSREKAQRLIEIALRGIETGWKGAHCCGNTDWPLLLSTGLDILSFDAYNYVETLSLYPQEVASFMNRGGVIAWGIVPTAEEPLKGETVPSLMDRLTEAMAMLERKGIPKDRLLRQDLVTPSCGLGTLPCEAAERALELTAEVSGRLRKMARG